MTDAIKTLDDTYRCVARELATEALKGAFEQARKMVEKNVCTGPEYQNNVEATRDGYAESLRF